VPILIFLHLFIIYDLFIIFQPTGKAFADGKRKKRKKKG
jgi:hypothetical protein